MTGEYDTYFWTGTELRYGADNPSGLEPILDITPVTPVVPLDDQSGATKPLTVPANLHNAVFGLLSGAPAPSLDGGQHKNAVLPGTFAILDAAMVQGLPRRLALSGLDHACLFQGEAARDLGNVAPWIVRLKQDNPFTQGLFTRGSEPHHLWDAEAGIFLRSQNSLEDIRKQFRKFTKVCDDAGAWFYLRLWDPRVMRALLRGAPHFGRRILSCQGMHNDLVILTCFENRAEYVRLLTENAGKPYPIKLGPAEKAVLRDLTFGARADALMTRLDRGDVVALSPNPLERQIQRQTIVSALHRMHSYGFQQPLQQDRWALWELFYGAGFEKADPALLRLCKDRTSPSGQRFTEFQRRLEELYP